MTVGPEMVIDTVDRADNPIGQVHRAEVFREHANFRVAHVLIFSTRGDLLLQQLAFSRDRNPGTWGSSVAAYLYSKEDYRDAAIRRSSEELGVGKLNMSLVGKTVMIDNGSQKFITVFRAVHDGPFRIDHEHVERVQFLPPSEVETAMKARPEFFTPTFRYVFAFYLSKSHGA
jgi:isopentenyl-diphosphate Delta-isomerase